MLENGEKQQQVSLAKKQLFTCSSLFCTFLCRCFTRLQRKSSRNFLHVFCRKCRTCSRSRFSVFHCCSFSPCIGGRQHFSFYHSRYKIFMLFFQQKMSPLFFISLALDLCRSFSRRASLASVFLLLYIPNLWT